jgi:hypothetical protein
MFPNRIYVSDVANDQGGWVNVRCYSAAFDAARDCGYPATQYGIWRLVPGTAAFESRTPIDGIPSAIDLSMRGEQVVERNGCVFVVGGAREFGGSSQTSSFPPGTWQYVGSVPAVQQMTYNAAVPTYGLNGTMNTFVVTAHTIDPGIWYISEVDSGASIDNLAPGTPANIANELVHDGLQISWDPNHESDLSHYAVHRDVGPDYVPGIDNLVGEVTDPVIVDPDWEDGHNYHYKISAIDRAGNESDWAILLPSLTPTLLQAYSVDLETAAVRIRWELSEVEAGSAFHVSRAATQGAYKRLTEIEAFAGTLEYSYVDRDIDPGTKYRYRVDVVDGGGGRTLFETETIETPNIALELHQNSPNPFNPTTTISFVLPAKDHVKLEIFDVSGKLVTTLLDRPLDAGYKECVWDGTDATGSGASTGVYFCRLSVGKRSLTGKMILVK